MSSILDALKKVEDEKAREDASIDTPLDEERAEDELLGHKRPARGIQLDLTPRTLIPIALGFVGVLVAVSLLVAFFASRLAAPPTQVARTSVPAVLTPAEESKPAARAEESVERTPAEQAISPSEEPAETVVKEPPRAEKPVAETPLSPPPERVVTQAPLPPPRPVKRDADPVEPKVHVRTVSEPEPRESSSALPIEPAMERSAPPPPVSPSKPLDPENLPILSPAQRDHLGLPELKVNFVSLANNRRPRPSALINYNRVYLDDVIPNTNARLIAVTMHGIGIEAAGQRYFVPSR